MTGILEKFEEFDHEGKNGIPLIKRIDVLASSVKRAQAGRFLQRNIAKATEARRIVRSQEPSLPKFKCLDES